MTAPIDSNSVRALELAREGLSRPGAPSALPERLLVVDAERQLATWFEAGEASRAWPVSTARAGHRRRARLLSHAAGLASHPPADRRRARARHGVRLARADRRDVARRSARRRSDPHPHPHARRARGRREPRDRAATRSSATSISTAPITRRCWAAPSRMAACALPTTHVCELFAQVREGDLVFVAAPETRPIPDPRGGGRFHYAGLGGAGMSALAQFQAMTGGTASGSDRAFDRGERGELREQLERLGIDVVPQDGSGVGGDCAALVVSTAVEEQVPDFAAARARGIPIIHRSELLAHFVAAHRTIAVTGTSGKSTVSAMIFEILSGAGRDPSVITGGDLRRLQEQGLPGNAFAGALRPARGRGRRERRLARALRARHRRDPQSPARPQGDGRGRGDVRHAARARARRPGRGRRGESRSRSPAARFASASAQRADIRGEDVELGPAASRFRVEQRRLSRCRCPARTTSPMRWRRSPPRAASASPLDEMVEPLGGLPGRRPALPDGRQGARRRGDRRFRAQRRQDRRRDQHGQAPRQAACSPSTSRTAMGRRASCARTSSPPSPASSRPTTAVDARSVLRRRHGDTRLLRRRHRGRDRRARGQRAEFAPSRDWLAARIAARGKAGRSGAGDGRARPLAQRACPRDPQRDRKKDDGSTGEIAQLS